MTTEGRSSTLDAQDVIATALMAHTGGLHYADWKAKAHRAAADVVAALREADLLPSTDDPECSGRGFCPSCASSDDARPTP